MRIKNLIELPSIIMSRMEVAALEDKLEILNLKFREILAKGNFRIKGNAGLDDLFEDIIDADPTKNKQYLQWLITKSISSWKSKAFPLWKEDLQVIHTDLELYDTLKKKNKLKPEHKDINRIPDHIDLFNILQTYDITGEILSKNEERKAQELEFFNKKQAKLILNNATWKIVIPLTEAASCFFGINTRWCTAAKKDNMFNAYSKNGPLYIILHKPTNTRWQFHFESMQFMDETDTSIDWNVLYKQSAIINELRKIFTKQAKKVSFIPLMANYNYIDVGIYAETFLEAEDEVGVSFLHLPIDQRSIFGILHTIPNSFYNNEYSLYRTINFIYEDILNVLPTTNGKEFYVKALEEFIQYKSINKNAKDVYTKSVQVFKKRA